MGQVYTFHETTRGYLHVMNGTACEDSSASFSAEDDRYFIAIVADGHGSKSCFRSKDGAKIATDVALECLQQFAEATLASKEVEEGFYKDIFSNPRYRQTTIRRLTDTIIAGWYDRILDDYADNPPTSEEICTSEAEFDGSLKNVAHIYGTTLIAALQLPKCLLLVHQGDGRCDVFYSDGTIDQPIPWDSRCEDAVTTSLCDEDAADSFRHYVVNLTEKPVMACYLGSDGVEDTYRDTYEGMDGSHVLMGGVHTFYKYLTYQLADRGQEEFEKYLRIMLPEFSAEGRFSRSGSGDDVSVAGIVDTDTIQRFTKRFQYDVKRYALEEDLFWKEDELRGKTRKHGILQKRIEEAGTALKEAKEKRQMLENAFQTLMVRREECSYKVKQMKEDLEEYQRESQLINRDFGGQNIKQFYAELQKFFINVSTGYSEKQAAYEELKDTLRNYDRQIRRCREQKSEKEKEIREMEKRLTEAQDAFDEYNAKYQTINVDRMHIKKEIATLLEGREGNG